MSSSDTLKCDAAGFVFNSFRQIIMAELPPDIMGMLSRGNLPDEDEFDDFMDQVSDRSTPFTRREILLFFSVLADCSPTSCDISGE